MTPAPWSLRRRLMVSLGVAALIFWCVSSAWIYVTAVQESDQMLDAALDHTAHAVLAVVRNEASELNEEKGGFGTELAQIDHSDQNDIVYQILGPNGGLVFRSHGAPTAMLAAAHDRGFQSVRVDGKDFRVFTLATELDAATIHVAQPLARRIESARAYAARILAPAAALMLALMLAVAWSVRRAIDPVARYANALDELPPEANSSLDASRLPKELQPVARAIDRLLARVRDALLRERTLTADAAHELRTPLAALRLQAQVAYRSTRRVERNAVLEELLTGADRAARMVESILTLARLDATSELQIGTRAVGLRVLAQLVAQEFVPLAESRAIRISVEADESKVLGDDDALAIALRNVLSNALRYARSQIRVQICGDHQLVSMRILDDGPGFSGESAQRAFHRFFRGTEGGQPSDGAGLGLALVLRIAQLHCGTARLIPGIDKGAGIAIELPGVVRATAS